MGWSSRYYSEQYLLAVLLLADTQRRYEILFPSWFIFTDDELRKTAEETWKDIELGKSYHRLASAGGPPG